MRNIHVYRDYTAIIIKSSEMRYSSIYLPHSILFLLVTNSPLRIDASQLFDTDSPDLS